MAYEDNYVTQDERDRPPTPEEIQASQLTEAAKRDAIAGTVGQMNALAARAAQPAPVLPPGNRIYMGPNVGDPTASPREFFGDVPRGTVINRIPPPTPEQVEGAAGRVAAMMTPLPPDPGITAISPEMRRFSAQQAIQRATAGGMPMSDALRLYGGEFFLPGTTGKRYNVAGVGLVDESGRVITARPQVPVTRTVPGVGLVNAQTGAVITPAGPRTSPALLNRHKALVAEVTAAKQGDDAARTADAMKALSTFEDQYGSQLGIPAAPTTTGTAAPAATPAVSAPTGTPRRISTKAQFDALPSGTVYIGKDGKRYKKP